MVKKVLQLCFVKVYWRNTFLTDWISLRVVYHIWKFQFDQLLMQMCFQRQHLHSWWNSLCFRLLLKKHRKVLILHHSFDSWRHNRGTRHVMRKVAKNFPQTLKSVWIECNIYFKSSSNTHVLWKFWSKQIKNVFHCLGSWLMRNIVGKSADFSQRNKYCECSQWTYRDQNLWWKNSCNNPFM